MYIPEIGILREQCEPLVCVGKSRKNGSGVAIQNLFSTRKKGGFSSGLVVPFFRPYDLSQKRRRTPFSLSLAFKPPLALVSLYKLTIKIPESFLETMNSVNRIRHLLGMAFSTNKILCYLIGSTL